MLRLTASRVRIFSAPIALLVTLPLLSAPRTFVSAQTGSDVNVCSVQQPCRSFAAAKSFTDTNGEIVVLDSGGYGAVTIDRGMVIVAPSGIHAAITATSGTAITVNAGSAETVVLQGLYISGAGGGVHGIDYVTGGRLVVDHCVISNFSNSAVTASAGGGHLYVADSVARNALAGFIYGTLDASPIRGTFTRVRVENTTYGIAPSANAHATVTQSVASGNGYGFYSGASGSSVLNIDSSVTTFNQCGIFTFGISRVRNSLITQNTTGIAGVNNFSFGNNGVSGNGTNGAFNGVIPQQ